ncbi:MAG: MATE family efflux transporter [Burkholderiaceae bacterium]
MQQPVQQLLHAPIGGMLLRLAAPNVAATIMTTASTFADAWYVGHLGTVALASLAVVFPLQTLMIMTSGGAIGGGVTSAVSRALGRADSAAAQSNAWHGLLIGIVLALIFMMILGVMARPVFSLLVSDTGVLDGAVRYAHIAFGGAITVVMVWVLSAILRGTGDTITPARAVVVSGAAQVGLSGALTLGWGPFPSLGVVGPATALVVCQGLASAYLLLHLLSGRATIRLRPEPLRWQPVADIMRVGGLGLINSFTIALTVVTVTGFVARYGTEALAGYGLGSRLELMLVPIAFGIGGALTVGVGANVGAQQFARARRIAWTGGGFTLAFVSVIGLVVALVPSLWLNLFTADASAYAIGALYLAIAGPLYGVFAGGQSLYFANQGTGRMFLPVLVGVVRFVVVALIGGLAVYFSWPLTIVFAGVAVGLVIIGVGLSLCMRTTPWFEPTR